MRIRTIIVSLVASVVASGFGQGTLTPPGAPTPSMKSLDQIEPRTPVDAIHTPGNSSEGFIISQPGSYYLATNVMGLSGKDGIEIATNNVTLDLNGFALLGAPDAHYGIYIPTGSYSNVLVRNGSVSAWGNNGYFGIASFIRNLTLQHLNISGNAAGVYSSGTTVIRDCAINDNSSDGIFLVASDSLVIGNSCIGNNAANLLNVASIHVTGSKNRIEDNHVTASGANGNGILVANSSANNIVIRNSVEGGGANNYVFNTSQIVGPIISNTISGIITNSNPWANFSF